MKRPILAFLTGAVLAASSPAYAAVKRIVLVDGAFADGSGWKSAADILQSHGCPMRVVQEPETSFAADVAETRRAPVNALSSCRIIYFVAVSQRACWPFCNRIHLRILGQFESVLANHSGAP